MRIRQLALVARDLEPVLDDLCTTLGIEICFRDPGVEAFGLHNALMPIGDTFLEVVSPLQEGTTAGRLLDRRGGDGGYMVIVQSDDLEADRARLAGLEVRIVWETALPDIATIHLHPRDVGGAIVSIDAATPPESWRWAGPDWKSAVSTRRCARIEGVTLDAHDPDAMASRWSAVLGRTTRRSDDGAPEIALDQGVIRFEAAGDRGEGFAGFEVACVDPGAVRRDAERRGLVAADGRLEVCGTHIRLV